MRTRDTEPGTDDESRWLADDELPGAGSDERGSLAAIARRARGGSLSLLAGGVLLARALRRATTSRWRAGIQGLAGASLIALGLRQRRSRRGDLDPRPEGGSAGTESASGQTEGAHATGTRPDPGSRSPPGPGDETADAGETTTSTDPDDDSAVDADVDADIGGPIGGIDEDESESDRSAGDSSAGGRGADESDH